MNESTPTIYRARHGDTEWSLAHKHTGRLDPIDGARPLKRVIQQRLQNPLAVELLKKESAAGIRVRIDFMHGEFTFDQL